MQSGLTVVSISGIFFLSEILKLALVAIQRIDCSRQKIIKFGDHLVASKEMVIFNLSNIYLDNNLVPLQDIRGLKFQQSAILLRQAVMWVLDEQNELKAVEQRWLFTDLLDKWVESSLSCPDELPLHIALIQVNLAIDLQKFALAAMRV